MSDRHPFRQQAHARARGRLGEDEAERWLLTQGYQILERNVVNRVGEIDLIARDGGVLCFVEIKARSTTQYGPAIAAISASKQRKLSRVAALYLASHPWEGPCRFDVLAMDLEGDGWRFTLIKDAFQAS